ncbi:type II toxin-antitoxin system VapC family toxin [Candidatus Woesearchaeota archaeon]|nr:type II toxin-antitoxin system VapC family toxin [Candidatus Woesearchaeota archaeon]
MNYLDANFFIYALFDQTIRGKNARKIQEDIINGKKKTVTSVLTIDEVMWVLLKNQKKHLLRKVIEDIYSMPNLNILEVSPSIALKALDIMEKYSLKPRDSFHLAIMQQQNITVIISDDADFDKVALIKRIHLD